MANFETTCQYLIASGTSIEQLLNSWKEYGVKQWEIASVLWVFSVLNSECKRSNVQVSSDCDCDRLERQIEKVIAQGQKDNYFSEECLKECLEMESLESNGLLSSSTQWTRRAIRTNTRLFYTQEKFNLLREETEGFAKLITDLLGSHRSRDSTTKQHTRLVSLVGCFDLDPNRVVDLIWNASAYCNEKCGELLSLMSTFRSDYISQILGFKFQNCQWNRKSLCTETEESVNFDSTFSPILAENSTVPYSELGPLIEVAAEALSRQLIRLCDIWPHLSPEDSVIFTRLIEFANEVDKTTAEFGVVSLSGGESSLGSRVSRTEQPFKTYEDFEQGPFSEGLFSKIELICALLERGSWNIVVDCMKILSDSGQKNLSDFGQQLCSHPRYRTVLVAIAEQVLEKFLGKTLNLSLSCPSSANNYFLKMKEEKLLMLFGFQGFEDLLHKEVKGAEQKHHALVYILLSLGPYIKQSCRCLFLLCRFVQKQLNESDGVRNLGLRLLVEVIFPAMSCIKGNPALSIELWRTMCLLRFDERYQIYYLVKHSIRQEYSLVRRSNSWTSFETRRVLRRLAKENVKQFGRWLGKICNGNPLIAAECILEQVQSYENLIPVLIDALKYMTPLTFDIIMYSCLEQLDTCNKDKIKSDGMNLSQWYYGLCIFISGLIRKYFAFVDCRGLFHFIFNKLEEGDSVYVFLLLEILSRVSGGGNTEHLSDSQMSSLGGGPLLREIVASALSSSLPETKKVSRKAAEMIKNLVNSEGLVADLAILVAQQKESILFDSVHREIPLRMICNIFDKCQETLILYTDLILGEDKCSHIGGDSDDVESRSESHTNGKPDTLNFPSFQSLVVDYHIPYVSAFLFMRPYLVFENIFNMSPDTSNLSREPFHISCLTKVFPDSMWESISPELFVAFWTLKLYDIHVPKDSYLMELQRLRSMVYDDQVTENDIHSLVRNVKESRRHRQAGRKLEETLSLLEEEMRVHESHYQRIQSLLCERKSFFFTQISNAKNWSIVFLQICLIPRCISSFSDAAFCSKFLEVLLDLDPPGLRILPLFHYLLLNIGEISQCLTEAEATRFGNFVAEVLKILNEWWMNENKYNAECHKRLAFSLEVNEEQGSGIKYSEFATWNREVHSVMTKSMLSNLDSDNYLDIRNSIEILSRVIKYFPRIESHGLLIQRKLQEVIENKNETFRVVASRYLSLLQNERGNWISHAEVDPIDSVKLKGDLLDTNFLHSFRHLYNSEVSTMFSQKSEPTQMTPEEMEEMHIDEQIEKQNTQITVEQDSSSAMPEQSVYDEELQVASTHLEDPKTMSILEVNEKMDSSHITDPTHAELARIQAAVAEKRQLLQREREKRNRLPEQNAKEELSLKNATKETPEPGEITKGSSRSVYKKEPSSSRDSSDDLEARKRRRGLVEEEGANASDTNRRNKRERTDAVTSSRNDIMNASRAKDTLSSSRSYSPGSRTYSGAIGDSNRNRNSRSSYVSQERVFREGESSNRVRRPSVSEQREKKAEDPDNREAYSSTRMSSRSRKSRK